MELIVDRKWKKQNYTISNLTIDGKWSIYIILMGDTIYNTKIKYLYKYKYLRDTISINDTISKIVTVTKIQYTNRLNLILKFLIAIGIGTLVIMAFKGLKG